MNKRKQIRDILNLTEVRTSYGESLFASSGFSKNTNATKLKRYVIYGNTKVSKSILEYIQFEVLPYPVQRCIDLIYQTIQEYDD
jgi:hypothetical protein